MRSFGSGQTHGLPLLLTTAAQVLHTAPAGSATPHRVRLEASNVSGLDKVVHVGIYDNSGVLDLQMDVNVPHTAHGLDLMSAPGFVAASAGELVLNGGSVIKVWADDLNAVYVHAVIDDQGDVAGIVSQNIASGLIAAVQNSTLYGVNVNGGSGQATRANGEIVLSRAGTLRNLRVVSDAAVGGGATLTVSVFVNGVASALSQTLANADGTAAKTDTDAVAVSAGDKITFAVACDNVGAPAANVHACVEFV